MIVQLAKLSILANGTPHGYFEFGRGVRQGDPLSPLLFCIVEDVQSRGILKLRTDGKLNYIATPRGVLPHSHVFYVDDLTVFYRADRKSLNISTWRLLSKFKEEY